jgi:hypothetical protein
MLRIKIENKKITSYGKFLAELSRPPSKGGNTNARHSHVLEIDSEKYSFLALGSQQWVFKTDSVSFEFEVNQGYKNIIKETIETIDRNGQLVVRGNRGSKKLRSSVARVPSNRKEQ